MPKSSKKTAKVEAAAVVPIPTKALKKGTRDEAEESIKKSVVAAAKKKEETSSDDDESSDEEDAAPSKTDNDVVMTEAAKTPTPMPPSPSAPKESFPASETGNPRKVPFPTSKTLVVFNLNTSARLADLESFFKSAGEVVDYVFPKSNGKFWDFALVEFATSEAAEKALELNGKELLGCKLVLCLDRVVDYTDYKDEDPRLRDPLLGWCRDSYERDPLSGHIAFFRGFSRHDGEEEIKSYVDKIFKNSSGTPKISIPKKKDGSLMRFAYLMFGDEDSMMNALYLSGSKVGESTFYIHGPVVYQENYGKDVLC